jgi:TonB family protein
MLAVRAPFSALGGALLSCLVFVGLAQLVNAPFDTRNRVLGPPFVLEPPRPAVLQTTPELLVIYDPPRVLAPHPPTFTVDRSGINDEPIRYTRPTLGERPGRRLPLRGFDGDVVADVLVHAEYPPRAITGNIEGWVRVRFTVTANGTVRNAVVVESEPGTVFDDAALKAIARWRYNPRVVDGEAVERVGLQYLFKFTLENGAGSNR